MRKSLREADLDIIDGALVDAAMVLAKSVDHLLKQQANQLALPETPAADVFGDTKFAYHLRLSTNAYIAALHEAMLTPQSRAQYLDQQEVTDSPFAKELADVRSIMRD